MIRRFFSGESVHRLDGKGRVSVPADFRRVLETCDPEWSEGKAPRVVLVYGDPRKPYLEGYSIEEIERIWSAIEALPLGSRSRRMLSEIYQARSHTTQVDPSGRLVVPAELRARIGLADEAMFVGMGRNFEIWPPALRQETRERELAQWLDELGEADPLSVLSGPEGAGGAAPTAEG